MPVAQARASRDPVLWCQLEDPIHGPMRPEPQDLLEIGLRVEAVERRGGDERAKGSVPGEAGLIGEEGPVGAADH